MRKLITFVVILYTVINVNSYSQLSNNHKVFAARTELYEYNGLNALLSADSSFSFCLSTNARPFSNLNLYSGGINARSPLFYDRINIAMDFRGDFSPLFSNYAVAIGVISKITDNYNLALHYTYDNYRIKNLNNNSKASVIFANSLNFNRLNINLDLQIGNTFDNQAYSFQNFYGIIGYKFSENYLLDLVYAYNSYFKNSFGISNKLIINELIHLQIAYYANPNCFSAGALLNLNRMWNIALKLNKSEYLPFQYTFQTGLRL